MATAPHSDPPKPQAKCQECGRPVVAIKCPNCHESDLHNVVWADCRRDTGEP